MTPAFSIIRIVVAFPAFAVGYMCSAVAHGFRCGRHAFNEGVRARDLKRDCERMRKATHA